MNELTNQPDQTPQPAPVSPLADTYPYDKTLKGQSRFAPLTPTNPGLSMDGIKDLQPLKATAGIKTILGQSNSPLSNPIVDPLFNTEDAMNLLMTFRKGQALNIVRNLTTTGPMQFGHIAPMSNVDRNDILIDIPEHSGAVDTFIASGIHNNFTARAIYKLDQYGLFGGRTDANGPGSKSLLDNVFGPDATSDFNANAWFADSKNRAYLNGLPGQTGKLLVENWIRGDYNDIHHASEFFAIIGSDMADNSYRDVLNNADVPTSLIFGAPAMLADPAAWITGEIAAAGVGRALFGAGQVASAAGKSGGLLTAVRDAAISGTAFSIAQEAGLHTIDKERTVMDSIDAVASNVILSSIMAGFGHMIFKGKGRTAKTGETATEGSPVEAGPGPDGPAPIDGSPVDPVKPSTPDAGPKKTFLSPDRTETPENKAMFDQMFADFEKSNTTEAKAKIYGKPASGETSSKGGILSPDVAETPEAKAAYDKMFQELEGATFGGSAPEKTGILSPDVTETPANKDYYDQIFRQFEQKNAIKGQEAPAKVSRSPEIDAIDAEASNGIKQKAVEDAKAQDNWMPDADTLEVTIRDQVSKIEAPEGADDFMNTVSDAHRILADELAKNKLFWMKSGREGVSGEKTGGYSDYFPYFGDKGKLNGAIAFINKLGNNAVLGFGNITVHAAQFTNNPKLAMFYQKFYNALLPSKAIAKGKAGKSIPFETIDGFIKAKGDAVIDATDRAFAEFVKTTDPTLANKFMFSDFSGKDMWSPELLAKYQAWNELLDRTRAEAILKIYANRPTDLGKLTEAGSLPDMPVTDMKSDIGLNDLYETLGIKSLSDVPAEAKAKMEAILQPLVDDQIVKLGEIRGNSPDIVAGKPGFDKFLNDPLRMGHDAVVTSVALPENMTAKEFVDFYNLARNPDPAQPWTLKQIIDIFDTSKPGSLFEQDLVAPNEQTINRLVQSFYNDMGGYVSKERLGQVLALTRETASDRLIRMDIQRTVRATSRMMQNYQLGKQLHEYLSEAVGFDPALKEVASDLVKSFNDLNATRYYHGEGQIGKEAVQGKLLMGFIDDLKSWNENALKVIHENMDATYHENLTTMSGDVITEAQQMSDKALARNVINDLRKRSGLSIDAPGIDASVMARNVLGFSRNAHALKSGISGLHDTASILNAVALSPFKGDFKAIAQSALVNISGLIKSGKPMGALLDNIAFIRDGLQDVQINRTGQFDPRSFDPTGYAKPIVTAAQKIASVQENVAGTVIRHASLGEAVQELNKSISLLSTVHQLTSSEGLFPRLAKALDEVQTGKTWQEALVSQNVPEWYANTAMRYFDAQGIKTIDGLIQQDITKEISTPRRFFLDKFLGEQKIKVLDLPEAELKLANGDVVNMPELKTAMENLGMLVSDMATHEKMAYPSWGDDLFGANTVMKTAGSFWLRTNTALFNRSIIGQTGKSSAARLGYLGTVALSGTMLGLVSAAISGPEAVKKYLESMDNFPAFVANQAGWSGIAGGVGGKAITTLTSVVSGKTGASTALTPAPVAAVTSGLHGVSSLYKGLTGGNATKSQADSVWKLMSAAGFANDTTGAQALGRFGRSLGVYGKENNAPDVQNWMYQNLGANKETK